MPNALDKIVIIARVATFIPPLPDVSDHQSPLFVCENVVDCFHLIKAGCLVHMRVTEPCGNLSMMRSLAHLLNFMILLRLVRLVNTQSITRPLR